jgi:hypothetical protein
MRTNGVLYQRPFVEHVRLEAASTLASGGVMCKASPWTTNALMRRPRAPRATPVEFLRDPLPRLGRDQLGIDFCVVWMTWVILECVSDVSAPMPAKCAMRLGSTSHYNLPSV